MSRNVREQRSRVSQSFFAAQKVEEQAEHNRQRIMKSAINCVAPHRDFSPGLFSSRLPSSFLSPMKNCTNVSVFRSLGWLKCFFFLFPPLQVDEQKSESNRPLPNSSYWWVDVVWILCMRQLAGHAECIFCVCLILWVDGVCLCVDVRVIVVGASNGQKPTISSQRRFFVELTGLNKHQRRGRSRVHSEKPRSK